MKKEKPIIFNTDMVLTILNGKKTVTRRVMKGFIPKDAIFGYTAFTPKGYISCRGIFADGYGEKFFKLPYQPGDILYVRETFQYIDFAGEENGYVYKASENGKLWETESENWTWRPSIHMPKEAARLYLKVKSVRIERLQDMTEDDAIAEGFEAKCPFEHRTWIGSLYDDGHESMCWAEGECHNPEKWCNRTIPELFGRNVWNKTIKKSDLVRYGWDASPWVWVIEFEKTEKRK